MKKTAFIIIVFSLFSCGSNETQIENYENPKKALLVIDMQIFYIGENGKFTITDNQNNQAEDLISVTNEIIEYFYANNFTIIYIKNVFKANDFRTRFLKYAVIEGTPDAEIDPRMSVLSHNIFDKYSPNAFTSVDFEYFLINSQINEIFLCGVLADECVYETAMGAFNRGYKVNYYGNAVGATSAGKIERAVRKLKNRGINVLNY